jgi:formate dehydrogenase beta subunit
MSPQSKDASIHVPCSVGCPVHTDNRQLVDFIIHGKYEQALDLLLDANPFSSVCGRICHHPCEQNCRRSKVEAPIGLRRLKRFVMEATKEHRKGAREKRDAGTLDRGKVAIVGSGPSGMTAARDLVNMGYSVTVFERSESPGGLLGNAIPRYRLPYDAVMEDIEDILSFGVDLVTGKEIGRDLSIEELFEQDYRAVLVATGLSESRALNVPGIDSEGVLLAIPFLRTVLSPNPPVLGRRVVVLGGGNVAIDVARSARRLGAEKVTIICLESAEEMPAWKWEIEEAHDEGISVMNSWGLRRVFTESRHLKALELRRCTGVFDSDGRFNPQYDEGDTATVLADNVIISIGQRGDLTCLEGSGIEITPGGRLTCDMNTQSTSRKGVFACGEVLTGPGSAVEAVRDGHRAAKAVAHYLETGELLEQPRSDSEMKALGELPVETIEKIKKRDPVALELVNPERRIQDFVEIERVFTEAEALGEAKRCLACTTGAFVDEEKCAACLTCVRICPFGVASIEKTAIMPQEKCQACGLCATQCPAAAIALKRFGTTQMRDELKSTMATAKRETVARPLIVSFCCLFEVTSRSWVSKTAVNSSETGIVRVMIPCVARLGVIDILAPFEMGADGVVIIGCSDGGCLYPTAEERLAATIREAKGVLAEIGEEEEVIDYWKTKGSAEVSWNSFWEISRRKLKQIMSTERGKINDSSRAKTTV